MALFPQDALNPGVRKREVFGWAMYDFANSGYTTVVLTAVFSAYFVGGVAGGANWATFAWTLTLAASSLVVMLTMPALGAYADLRGAKKRLLVLSTLGCVLATAALAGAGPGDIAWAVVFVILSNICFSYGESLIAAFLPELARPESLGRVSGWGWSFGYFGGMLALGLSLGYVLWAQAKGLPASHFVPVTMVLTAVIFGLASLLTFALLKERAQPQAAQGPQGAAASGLAASLAQLARTWHEARRFRDFSSLLACAVAYQAGISVVVALAAIYAEQALKCETADTIRMILLVNMTAARAAAEGATGGATTSAAVKPGGSISDVYSRIRRPEDQTTSTSSSTNGSFTPRGVVARTIMAPSRRCSIARRTEATKAEYSRFARR
jgi:UMF1 family MFS transporter